MRGVLVSVVTSGLAEQDTANSVLEWSQYQAVIDAAVTLRDKLAIKVGSGTAVRPGELFAFRWRSLEEMPGNRHALRVAETIYKSKIRPWAKTENSEAYVPLAKRLAAELEEWHKLSMCPADSDFIFPMLPRLREFLRPCS